VTSTDPPEADHPDEPLDPGMQAERTYLAWQRTGLGLAAVGVLMMHSAVDGHPPLVVPGGLTLVAAAVLTARAQHRFRSTVALIRAGHSPVNYRLVALTAGLVGVLCLVALTAITVF
jgi:uncharacterized membrane protein YidH (DUF202 family)